MFLSILCVHGTCSFSFICAHVIYTQTYVLKRCISFLKRSASATKSIRDNEDTCRLSKLALSNLPLSRLINYRKYISAALAYQSIISVEQYLSVQMCLWCVIIIRLYLCLCLCGCLVWCKCLVDW